MLKIGHIGIAALDIGVPSIPESSPLVIVFFLAPHNHLSGVSDVPVVAQTVVKLIGFFEVTIEHLALLVHLLFKFDLLRQIKVVLKHGKSVIFQILFGLVPHEPRDPKINFHPLARRVHLTRSCSS